MTLVQHASTPLSVTQALQQASRATGTDFDYLLETARRESGLNPNAVAKTSSATGLFQFIEQTWLGTVKQFGAQHGLAAEAAQIEQLPNGRYQIADPARKQEILALRKDPAIAATMAAELTQSSASQLESVLGRKPTSSELYTAHFLGASGASQILKANQTNPAAAAADQFPAAAKANKSIFYDRAGNPKSVSAVVTELGRLHDSGEAPTIQMASVPASTRSYAPPMFAPPAFPTYSTSAPLPSKSQSTASMGALPPMVDGPGMAPIDQRLLLSPSVVQLLATLEVIPGGQDNKNVDKSQA